MIEPTDEHGELERESTALKAAEKRIAELGAENKALREELHQLSDRHFDRCHKTTVVWDTDRKPTL